MNTPPSPSRSSLVGRVARPPPSIRARPSHSVWSALPRRPHRKCGQRGGAGSSRVTDLTMCGRLAVAKLVREHAAGLASCAPSRKERLNEHELARGHGPPDGGARPAAGHGHAGLRGAEAGGRRGQQRDGTPDRRGRRGRRRQRRHHRPGTRPGRGHRPDPGQGRPGLRHQRRPGRPGAGATCLPATGRRARRRHPAGQRGRGVHPQAIPGPRRRRLRLLRGTGRISILSGSWPRWTRHLRDHRLRQHTHPVSSTRGQPDRAI